MERIRVIMEDITNVEIQAIVNAANPTLLGGGGVDGAIHRAAGPKLLEACRALHGCQTGEAKLTPAFDLKAEYVIHTVGPVWQGGEQQEAQNLALCYENSLKLAIENKITNIAFPSISTGAYGFPLKEACEIAFHTVYIFLKEHSDIEEVVFVCFDQESYGFYKHLVKLFQGEEFREMMEEKLKAGERHTWMVKDPNRLFQNQD